MSPLTPSSPFLLRVSPSGQFGRGIPSSAALLLPPSFSFTFWGVFSTLFSSIELIGSAVTLIFKFRSFFFFFLVLQMCLLDGALFPFLGVTSRVSEDIDDISISSCCR